MLYLEYPPNLDSVTWAIQPSNYYHIFTYFNVPTFYCFNQFSITLVLAENGTWLYSIHIVK